MHLSHILQDTTLEQKCAHFCSNVVYCEIWDRCIVGFVNAHFCSNVVSCEIWDRCIVGFVRLVYSFAPWGRSWWHSNHNFMSICLHDNFTRNFIMCNPSLLYFCFRADASHVTEQILTEKEEQISELMAEGEMILCILQWCLSLDWWISARDMTPMYKLCSYVFWADSLNQCINPTRFAVFLLSFSRWSNSP